MILTLILGQLALAEDIISQGETPLFNSQAFRPAIDSHHFIWANETELGLPSALNYRSTFSYASKPVVYRDYMGNETSLLSSVTQLDLAAGYTQGRIRYGLTAPVILNAKGESVDANQTLSEVGLGEAMADVKIQLVDRHDHRMGLAVNARSSLPSSTLESPLGTQGFMFEGEVALDAHFGETVFVANLGHRHQPEIPTEDVTWGPQIFGRLGYAVPFGEDQEHGIGLEGSYAGLYSDMSWEDNGVSAEGMLSGWFSIHHAIQVRAGVSKGFATGMTTPDWRGVLALTVIHKTEKDTDGDGIVDHADECINVPEDVDGHMDSDGCPDPTKVNVLVMDHLGHEVRDAHWHSTDDQFSGPGHSSFFMQSGTIELDVDDDKYYPNPTTVVVRDQMEQNVFLEVELVMGSLEVIVKDEDDNMIPDATWSIDGIKGALFQPTGSVVPLKPGAHELVVIADGYRMLKENVVVEAQKTEVVHLKASKTLVTRDLRILDKIYFKTASHEIDARSHILLDEVADILDHYPLIELVHIEGHTDSQGKDEYNKKLSQARADEVRSYLIEKGIEPERLVAIGYGEERPIDTNDTDEGRAKNRRVIFEIKGRHGDDFDADGNHPVNEQGDVIQNNASESEKTEVAE